MLGEVLVASEFKNLEWSMKLITDDAMLNDFLTGAKVEVAWTEYGMLKILMEKEGNKYCLMIEPNIIITPEKGSAEPKAVMSVYLAIGKKK